MQIESFDLFEQQTDVCAIQVAEPTFRDSAEVGEEAASVRVELSTRYEDPIEEPSSLTVEEFVRHSTRDTKSALAFKSVVNELISRTSHSRVSAVRNCSLPSTCDFSADIFLCAKRSLGRHMYEIFCRAVDSQFEHWYEVPESLRKIIVERTGTLLIERGIFRGGTTRAYFFNGYKQRAPKPAQQLEAA